MEDYFHIHDQEEAEDSLSFCNLPINDGEPECDEFSQENPNPSSDQDLFEFFAIPKGCEINPTKNIIFCRKLIPYDQEDRSRSESFNTSHAATTASSLRIPSSKPSSSPATGSFRYSSGTRTRSRKHVFLFGMGKFPPTMQMSDMRKRQSRRTPAPLVPAVDGGEMVVAG